MLVGGEYSLFFAREFPNSNIFNLEGSSKNHDILLSNLSHNSTISKLINPCNIIIYDHNGKENITNEISTMNIVRDAKSTDNNNYIEAPSTTLSDFCKNEFIKNIDFIKALSNKYNFVNFANHNLESIEDMIILVSNILKEKSTIDLFLVKK